MAWGRQTNIYRQTCSQAEWQVEAEIQRQGNRRGRDREKVIHRHRVTETQRETGRDKGDRQTEKGETNGDRQTCKQRQGDRRGRERQIERKLHTDAETGRLAETDQ